MMTKLTKNYLRITINYKEANSQNIWSMPQNFSLFIIFSVLSFLSNTRFLF